VIRVPIEDRFAPTFFLSAATLVGDQMYSTQQQITVAPEGKLIKLEIKPDKDEYKPGEKGTITVRALNNEGEPAPQVDVALAVVDEAIYAIRPDNTPEIETFFYGQRWNQVNTSSSLDFRFYNVAREAAEDMMFMDAEEAGNVSLSAAAPTGRAQEMKALRLAGNKDDAGEAPLVAPTIRKDFRDLMFWTHSVRTDANGYATIPVEFPDNLTTWRITARGVTKGTQVGQATSEVIARKDLLVRMETPRFLTQGDKLVIATNVHNYLSTPKQVKVEFTADGVTQEKRTQSVTIPANGEERIDWKIEAKDIGTASFTVKALTNEESDAMELKIPILPQGVKSGASAIADIAEPNGKRDMRLTIPSNAKVETGELYINLSPSAASSMLGALDELIGYPYGCVEQTMSRFLPTVVVADVLEELSLPFDQKKREEMPKMVDQGLKRLYTLQHGDGGWGWWENDETNPFMTAYVMYGLTVARKAGYQISDERYVQGMSALYSLIEARIAGGGLSQDDKRLNITTEAYMLYVASVADPANENNGMVRERINDLADEKKVNNYAIALLALAAHEQGDTRNAKALAGRLIANVTETGGGAFWSGESWHYNWQDDQVETSAAAVKALLKIEGETELVSKGVRWLLAQKNGAAWHNTRQTAMVIYSLTDYLRASNELAPDYTMVVKVNGKEVLRKHITKEDVFKPEQTVKVVANGLRSGENVVTVEKSGSGRLYASARLVYFATGNAIKPGVAGFKVEREYYRLNRVKRKGKYLHEKQKITGPVKSGDEIFVKLKVTPESSYEYFIMEDPLPAGCEVITDTDGYTIVDEHEYQADDDSYYYRRWQWNWWFADRDVRDEKVAFFATSIQAQTYELSYIMRAQIPGEYSVMPAVASLMYYPEVRGNSGTEKVAIVD
ncbi:MAG: alpha-2-macroglobulin, partial [Candidatus Kapaibacterium sp.]